MHTHNLRQREQKKKKTHIRGTNRNTLEVHVHAGDDDGHLAWAFKSEHIGFLKKTHITHVVTQLQFWPVQNKSVCQYSRSR